MCALLAVLFLPAVAFAQGTKADYERSLSLGQRFGGKVFRDRVEPTWAEDGKRLWYAVALPDGAIDSQTAKAASPGGCRGYDGGKTATGRGKHISADAILANPFRSRPKTAPATSSRIPATNSASSTGRDCKAASFVDATGRPMPMLPDGEAISELG